MFRKISLFVCVATAGLLAAHAEGKAGDIKDSFAPDQVRAFTRAITLPGGLSAKFTVLAMQKHATNVEKVLSFATSEATDIATKINPSDPNNEINRINNSASTQPVTVSEDTVKLLQAAQKAHKATGGAFDIVPNGNGTARDIKISQNSVAFLRPNMTIDVKNMRDGYVADRVMQTIWDANIDNAMVEVGQASRSIGNDLVGPWQTTVTDMVGRYAGRGTSISFSNASAATVAMGSTSPAMNGRPATAKKPATMRSATVIAKDAVTAEAMANAVYKMGVTEGMQMANRMGNVHVLVRDNDGNLQKSNGL